LRRSTSPLLPAQADVGHEARRSELGKHPLFGLSAADRSAAVIEIERTAVERAGRIEIGEGREGVK
jgi:hypothetical protein